MRLSDTQHRRLPWLLLALLLALTALAYWPGTRGVFLLDDYPNLLESPAFQQLQPTLGSFVRATLSSHSGPTQRPIAMASFALNVLATGGGSSLKYDATVMKWTNVAIHLLNGLLIFLLLRLLLGEYRRLRPETSENTCSWVALSVTAAWLLAPINLTAVLYVIQRMTSLAATFSLLGLIAFVAGRRRLYQRRALKIGGLLLATTLLCTGLATFSKEDGALTMLYALVIEWVFFRLRNRDGRRNGAVIGYFTLFLLVPLVLGLIWVVPLSINPVAWQARNFNLGERILTEGRVIWHYAWWTLVPNLNSMSLFHDAFAVSHNLIRPWTTLLAWIGIAALAVTGFATRRRYPLIAFGLLWFLAGQAMTASFIPLELVYEHREYLPSLGLYVAILGTLLMATGKTPYKRLASAAIVVVIALYGVALGLRSTDWSNPLRQLRIAAATHPDSPRATYSYARILTIVTNVDPRAIPAAYRALEKSLKVPGQGILPDATLIILSHRTGHPIKAQWYQRMARVLADRSANAGDISAINSLVQCALHDKNPCHLDPVMMRIVFASALTRKNPNPAIMAMYGNYLLNVTHHPQQARKIFQALVESSPHSAVYHFDLGVTEVRCGNLAAAKKELGTLKTLNSLGVSNHFIKSLSQLIQSADSSGSMHEKSNQTS